MVIGRQMFTGCTIEDVAPAVLMTSIEEAYEEAVKRLRNIGDEVKGRGGFVSRKGRYHNVDIMILKTPIGAPSTAIALEELQRLGARIFVKVDTAFGLQRRLEPGTLIVPIAAVRGESVSKYYAPPEFPAIPSHRFLQLLDKVVIREGKVELYPTVVMSTDIFYMGQFEEYEKWMKLVGAVDMDTATLFTIARVRGLQAGALLVVDSNIWIGPREELWISESTSEIVHRRREEVVEKLKYAVEVGLEVLVLLYEYMKSEKAIEKLERGKGGKRGTIKL